MKPFTAKRLCRAGVISALYVALTYAFGALSYSGFLEIRPAEALTILPLFFGEAVPALYIGCMIANLGSPFFVYDVFIGSLATLIASLCTYFIGKTVRNKVAKFTLGGLFPVVINAIVIPMIIVFLCKDTGGYESVKTAYFVFAGSIFITQAVWVYGLGAPIYFSVEKLRENNNLFK